MTFTVLSHYTRPVFLVSWPLVNEQRRVRRSRIQNDAVLPRQETLKDIEVILGLYCIILGFYCLNSAIPELKR